MAGLLVQEQRRPALTGDRSPVATLDATLDGTLVAINRAGCELLGCRVEDLAGRKLDHLLTVGGRFFFETHCKPILASRGAVDEVSLELVHADGRRLPVVLYASRDEEEELLRVVLVTAFERRAADDELRRMRGRERSRHDLVALTARLSMQALRGLEPTALFELAARGVADLLPADLVTLTEADRLLATAGAGEVDPPSPARVAANAARALDAFSREPVHQEVVVAAAVPGEHGPVETALLAVPVGEAAEAYGVMTVHRRGAGRYNAFEIGAAQAVAAILWTAVVRFRDVQGAQHRSLHDPLTGLPNRDLLADRLESALRTTQRGHAAPAVLFLDLDDFKLVNDGLGHRAGDQLLHAVAQRLVSVVREVDTVARIGGDEFVVLCPEVGSVADGELVADRIREAMSLPFVLGGRRQWVQASTGFVLAPEGSSARQLLEDADAAMYVAKSRARGRHVVFDPRMREEAAERLRVAGELHEAILDGQLRCHFQPIVDITDGRPLGLEALVRWQHGERGLLRPESFLGEAQQSGLMDALGAEVLRQGCAALSGLRRDEPAAAGLHLAVNVSVSQLASPDIVELVAGLLEEHGLAGEPDCLRLEVTETLFADHDHVTQAVLDDLRALGVCVVIDDFGTGFSSLSRIASLPIDGLKVDRTFVRALGEDGSGDTSVIAAVLELGFALDLDVVCEGIETEPQRNRLQALGARRAQGHLFAEALELASLVDWLRGGAGRP